MRSAVLALVGSVVACDSAAPDGPPALDAAQDAGEGGSTDAFGGDSSASAPDAPLDGEGGDPRVDGGVDGRDSAIDVADSGAQRDAGDAGVLPSGTCPPGPFGSPVPAGAVLTRIAAVPPSDSFNAGRSDDTTVEGPVWIGQSLYVSEFQGSPNPPPSRILEITASGDVSVVVADSGSNGLAVDSVGTLYAAVHADGSISRVDLATGARTPVAATYEGKRFNSPNDLAIRRDGNIYFSDPTYQASTPPPQSATRVYRIAPGTDTVSVVDATLSQPNGVTLSLDENTLYVTSTHGLYAYPVQADGSTGAGTPFASGIDGDGMAIDCAGNLYVAVIGTGNVDVLNSAGAQVAQLSAAGVGAVTNVAFGGSDRKTLYVSAQGKGGQQGLFEVALDIPGMPY